MSVKTDTPIEEVAQAFRKKYDLVAVPVIDSIGRLVGRITVDDVMDEVREQAEREYQLASGLSQDVESSDLNLYSNIGPSSLVTYRNVRRIGKFRYFRKF